MAWFTQDIDTEQADFAEGDLSYVEAKDYGALELIPSAGALDLRGSSSYAVIDSAVLPATKSLTIEIWLRWGDYISNYTSFALSLIAGEYSNNDIFFGWNGEYNYYGFWAEDADYNEGEIEISQDVDQETWLHWAGVIDNDSGKMYFYENGELMGSKNQTFNFPVDMPCTIAKEHNSDSNHADVDVCEIRFWSLARTQQQIQDNMGNRLNGNETGLAAYYKADEGSGDTLTDYAGSSDGSITNGTWISEGLYFNDGERLAPQLDLSVVETYARSTVQWSASVPDGAHLSILFRVSLDGGASWSTWQEAANGGSIPGLSEGDDLSSALIERREVLSNDNAGVTPQLQDISVKVYPEVMSLTVPARQAVVEHHVPSHYQFVGARPGVRMIKAERYSAEIDAELQINRIHLPLIESVPDYLVYVGAFPAVRYIGVTRQLPALGWGQLVGARRITYKRSRPRYIWDVAQRSVATVYELVLTGDADGLDDLALPITSAQIRRKDGEPSYMSVVVPGTDQESAIRDRSNGDLVLKKGVRLADGTRMLEPLYEVDFDTEPRVDQGARRGSITLDGHRTVSSDAPVLVKLTDPTTRTISGTGLRYRCGVRTWLEPGDIVEINGEQFMVSEISYYIRAGYEFMEVKE